MPIHPAKFASRLLQTGQVTQYNGHTSDDGTLQKGLARAYQVMSAGQYSGTVNVTLPHYAASTIAFAATTPGTITDSANLLAQFKMGDKLIVTGSASNNGVYTISSGASAGTIRTTEATLLENAGAAVTLSKREARSNACSLDMNTGLLWSNLASALMGAASTGKVPFYDATAGVSLYDAFAYLAAINAAALAGYSDWRIPNIFELFSIVIEGATDGKPDATAFPGFSSAVLYWSSTTTPGTSANALYVNFANGSIGSTTKVTAEQLMFVRG